jgi:hypothetical protein
VLDALVFPDQPRAGDRFFVGTNAADDRASAIELLAVRSKNRNGGETNELGGVG